MASEQTPLTIRFTREARIDYLGDWHWNATQYSERRADSFMSFLESQINLLSESPSRGLPVPEFDGLFRYLVRRRSKGHGHYVFYRLRNDSSEIIRILHTAQDWPNHLDP